MIMDLSLKMDVDHRSGCLDTPKEAEASKPQHQSHGTSPAESSSTTGTVNKVHTFYTNTTPTLDLSLSISHSSAFIFSEQITKSIILY